MTTDLDRIPRHLRDDIDRLVTMARAVEGAVQELGTLYDRIQAEYDSTRHPALGEPSDPEQLDSDLHETSGLYEVDDLLAAIAKRAGCQHWAIKDALRYWEECGYIIRVQEPPLGWGSLTL